MNFTLFQLRRSRSSGFRSSERNKPGPINLDLLRNAWLEISVNLLRIHESSIQFDTKI
ncbi:hypothetical protein ACS0TY_018134 [Phlomoides rotata]